MQGATLLRLQGGSDVGAYQQNGGVGLQALQQRHQRKKIAGASGGKDCCYASALPVKAVSGKACGLLMTDYPVMKSRGLTKSFIDGDVMDTGNAKATVDSGAKKTFHYRLSAELRGGSRRLG